MKESIIKISTPISKFSVEQLPVDNSPLETTLGEDINRTEELEQLKLIHLNPSVGFIHTNTSHSGWKVSDILREIRLDNLEMDGLD